MGNRFEFEEYLESLDSQTKYNEDINKRDFSGLDPSTDLLPHASGEQLPMDQSNQFDPGFHATYENAKPYDTNDPGLSGQEGPMNSHFNSHAPSPPTKGLSGTSAAQYQGQYHGQYRGGQYQGQYRGDRYHDDQQHSNPYHNDQYRNDQYRDDQYRDDPYHGEYSLSHSHESKEPFVPKSFEVKAEVDSKDALWTFNNDVQHDVQHGNVAQHSDVVQQVHDKPGDPVINVFAPDEGPVETKPYADDVFPMYSVDGVPFYGSQVPEFQPSVVPESIPNTANLTSPSSPASTGHTPYGTPQASPFAVPASPNTASSMGSPLIGSDLASPYDASLHMKEEVDLGPLIDDSQPLFDSSSLAPTSSWGSANNALGVNALGTGSLGTANASHARRSSSSLGISINTRKSRALSDTWSAQERDAFLDSLDSQIQLAQQPATTASHDSTNRSDIDQLLAPTGPSLQFPSYPPVYVKPHSPQLGYTGGGGGLNKGLQSLDHRVGTNLQSLNSSGGGYNVTGSGISEGSLSSSTAAAAAAAAANTSSSGGIPNTSQQQLQAPHFNGRMRSISNPYEPSNELKVAQMFSCELCGKRFTRAYNLRSHMRTHTDERPFSCQHCGKAFARQHDRKRHEALHSGEKRFVCYGLTHGFQWGCRKRFARADALGRHFRTEAGKNCLRPLIEKICTNGSRKSTAPEGIVFSGVVENQPQLVLTSPERDSNQNISPEEREDHTRRTVIITAVAEQFQELVGDKVGPALQQTVV